MKNGKVGIGFVGVGCISGIYLENITKLFREIEVVGVCDLIPERAKQAEEKYSVKNYADMYELFQDPEVDIVLNITRPYEHYEVTKAALNAGKHVYSEKPLSPKLEEGKELIALAQQKGLLLGGAPDTFLGAGIQTCRKLIDDGYIGTPIGASAKFATHGPEHWHPDCEFIYQYGGGPMLDMGPYYVTALINLMGRVESVCGYSKKTFTQRPMLCGPKFGNMMSVDVPTFVMGTLRFENGAVGSLFTTFDIYNDNNYSFEIYGTEGTLMVPDPNTFGGPVKILRHQYSKVELKYMEMPLMFNYSENSRGLGLADMAKALTSKRDFRANCMQQLHVLEIMEGMIRSGEDGSKVVMQTPYTRSKAMNAQNFTGYLD